MNLHSCPFCKTTCAEVLAVELDLYAGVCRACGAHGPVRVLGPKQLVEHVKLQAASAQVLPYVGDIIAPASTADSNESPAPDFPERPSTDSAAALTRRLPNSPRGPEHVAPDGGGATSTSGISTRQQELRNRLAHRLEAMGLKAQAAAESLDRISAALDRLEPDKNPDQPAPQNALEVVQTEAETAAEEPQLTQASVRARVLAFTDGLGISANKAVQSGYDLGASHFTIHKFVNGIDVTRVSLKSIAKAMDKLEQEKRLAAPVESLGNKLTDAGPWNRAPAPVAPPRHARTP